MTSINIENLDENVLKVLRAVCNIRQSITCCICLDIFENPVSVDCQHTFCLNCFKKLVTYSEKQNYIFCPVCKKILKRRSYVANEELETTALFLKEYLTTIKNVWKYDILDSKTYHTLNNIKEHMTDNVKKKEKLSETAEKHSNTICSKLDLFDALMSQNSNDSNMPIFRSSKLKRTYAKKKNRLSQSLNDINKKPDKNALVMQWLKSNFNEFTDNSISNMSKVIYVKHNNVLRKTRSLDCIITKVKHRSKYLSGSDNGSLFQDDLYIEDLDDIGKHKSFENFQNDALTQQNENETKILFLMEEDCLKKFENEMLAFKNDITDISERELNHNKIDGKNKLIQNRENLRNPENKENYLTMNNKHTKTKHQPSFKWNSKKSKLDESNESGWIRMNKLNKDIKRKENRFKKLNVSSSSTSDPEKSKINVPKTKRSIRARNKNKSVIKSPAKPTVFKLDQFEHYLNQNLSKLTPDVNPSHIDEVKNELEPESALGYLIQCAEEINKNDKCISPENDDIFDVLTQKLPTTIGISDNISNEHSSNKRSSIQTEANNSVQNKVRTRRSMKNNSSDNSTLNIKSMFKKIEENSSSVVPNSVTKDNYVKTDTNLSVHNNNSHLIIKDRKLQDVQTKLNAVPSGEQVIEHFKLLEEIDGLNNEKVENKVIGNSKPKLSVAKEMINIPCNISNTNKIECFKQKSSTNLSTIQSERSYNEICKVDVHPELPTRRQTRSSFKNKAPKPLDVPEEVSSKSILPNQNEILINTDNNLNFTLEGSTVQEMFKRKNRKSDSDSVDTNSNVFFVDAIVHRDSSQNVRDSNMSKQDLQNVLIEKAQKFTELSKFVSDSGKRFASQKSVDCLNNLKKYNLNVVGNSDVHSLSNFSNESLLEESIVFFNTAIPYLQNIHELYESFAPIFHKIDEKSICLTELFNSKMEIVNSLKLSLENSQSKLSNFQEIGVQTDISLPNNKTYMCDAQMQFDSNVCSKCKKNSAICDVRNDTSKKHILNKIQYNEKPQITFVDNEGFCMEESYSEVSQKLDNKVNRKLQFSPSRKFKRIRRPSSDSDSDTSVCKRIRSLKELNKYMNRDMAVVFDSEKDIIFDSEISQSLSTIKNTQRIKLIEASPGIDCEAYMEKFMAKLSNEQNSPNPNVSINEQSCDVTNKCISILEKEYKGAHLLEKNENISKFRVNNNPVIKRNDWNNSMKNTLIDNLFDTNQSDNDFNKNNQDANTLDCDVNTKIKSKASNSSSNDLFSASLFSDTQNVVANNSMIDKTENNNASAHKTCKDPTTVFDNKIENNVDQELDDEVEMHMSTIINDSFDEDVQNGVLKSEDYIIEGTPVKNVNKRLCRTSLAGVPNLELIDLPNTEPASIDWVMDIAPPPEFQDPSSHQNTELLLFSGPSVISNTQFSNISALNKPIDHLSEDTNYLTPLENLSQVNENIKTPKTNSSFIPNPLLLVQKDKFSPLTIIKTTKPSRAICSTPKQKSILNYVSTPKCEKKNWNTTILSESMELTPVKEYNVLPQQPICVACTRLNKDQIMKTVMLATRFGGKYCKDFDVKITHVVVMTDDRNCIMDHTMKYVAAVAYGKWIVSYAWVTDCLENGHLLPEEPYEVLDLTGIAGPKKSRLTRKSEPLLKNFEIFCAQPFQCTTTVELQNIIIELGGEIILSPEKFTRKGKICLIITEAKTSQIFEQYQLWLESYHVVTVDIEWLSQCVGQYQITSMRPFILCLEEGIEALDYPPLLIAYSPDTQSEDTAVR